MWILLLLLILFASYQPGFAQQATSGLGDSSAIPLSPAQAEPYGINSVSQPATGTSDLYTRHRRFGQSTGIGASTMQTTSATIESSSAVSSRNNFAETPATAPASPFANMPSKLFSQSMITPVTERNNPYASFSNGPTTNDLDSNFGLVGRPKSFTGIESGQSGMSSQLLVGP